MRSKTRLDLGIVTKDAEERIDGKMPVHEGLRLIARNFSKIGEVPLEVAVLQNVPVDPI